jgi:hypothetical protein
LAFFVDSTTLGTLDGVGKDWTTLDGDFSMLDEGDDVEGLLGAFTCDFDLFCD